MIDPSRLDELECFRVDDDTPDDARVMLRASDLRDLVRLIPVVRAAIRYDEEGAVTGLLDAVEELIEPTTTQAVEPAGVGR